MLATWLEGLPPVLAPLWQVTHAVPVTLLWLKGAPAAVVVAAATGADRATGAAADALAAAPAAGPAVKAPAPPAAAKRHAVHAVSTRPHTAKAAPKKRG